MSTSAPVTPKPSIWSALGHFLKHAEVAVSGLFVRVFGADAAHNFSAASKSLLKTAVGKIAMTAVSEVQALAAGQDKRSVAFSKIVSSAKSNGIAVTDSIVNMLIELCVQEVKGNFGTSS